MSEAENKKSHLALKRTIGIITFLIFIAIMVWVTIKIGIPLVNHYFGGTDSTTADTGYFSSLVENNPISGRLIFLGIQILQVFVAFIPGEVVEVAAGAVFGPIEGTGLSLLGVTIGSTIIFLLTKWLGIKFVSLFVSEEKINSMKFIKNDRSLNNIVFIIFFIPGTPKDLLTYFVGLTRMKLFTFLGLSLIARIPSILTSTLAGDAINNNDWKRAAIIFGITAVISIIGIIIYNIISKKRSKKAESAAITETIAEAEAEADAAPAVTE